MGRETEENTLEEEREYPSVGELIELQDPLTGETHEYKIVFIELFDEVTAFLYLVNLTDNSRNIEEWNGMMIEKIEPFKF